MIKLPVSTVGSRRTSRRGSRSSQKTVSDTAIRFTGKVISPTARAELTTSDRLLNFTSVVTTDGTGMINLLIQGNMNSALDWASLASVWDEFRVLGARIEYCPQNKYCKSQTPIVPIVTPAVVYVDRNDTIVISSSYALASSNESAKKVSMEEFWFHEWKMDGTDEAAFRPTSSSLINPVFRIFSDGGTINYQLGRLFLYWRVQFRSAK